MTNTTGEIIITLESEERHYSYETMGVSFNSTDSEIIESISPMIEEDVGLDLKDAYEGGDWMVKKVESSQNTYLFPKSTAGI